MKMEQETAAPQKAMSCKAEQNQAERAGGGEGKGWLLLAGILGLCCGGPVVLGVLGATGAALWLQARTGDIFLAVLIAAGMGTGIWALVRQKAKG